MFVPVKLRHHTVNIPMPLHTCVSYLLENGNVEGIFRINGSTKRVKSITTQFLQTPDLDLNKLQKESDELIYTVHDIATVFKRLLSHYLGPTNAVIVDNPCQLSKIQLVCEKFADSPTTLVRETCSILDLSRSNTNILLYLTYQLQKISEMEKTTQMNVSNLAIIFQPHFFNSGLISDLEHLKTFKNAIEAYIEHNDILIEQLAGASLTPQTVKVKIVSTVRVNTVQSAVNMVAIETKKSDFLKRAFSMRVKRLKL